MNKITDKLSEDIDSVSLQIIFFFLLLVGKQLTQQLIVTTMNEFR